ncbi:SDR family oxidoreductase [Rhabdothermincola salaria]|uniref:SDR family oxidoreductase n=1 Tax=Rhabdothermincola salaria TaxID=2903142 RepID=UPI001E3BC898|nr:SDR family oxidoreductase [Rhabdothermincola salaria]MCD9622954.1 SDR family oxidoreductase [Rhabdothermincola salaria]
MSIASTADVIAHDGGDLAPPLVLSTAEATALADVLGGPVVTVPVPSGGGEGWAWADDLDAWRGQHVTGERAERVVVAVWAPVAAPRPVVDVDLAAWIDEAEVPLAAWCAALGVAASRVADSGTIVAVAERPAPLDCAGHGAAAAVADGVEALVRSLARSEGPRGVRVNLVTTPTRLAPDHPVAPAPSLASHPGTIEGEVAGAVTMLLGSGTGGVTGTVVHADCGRSWR